MIEETDTEAKGGDPAITITMALTAKKPQGTRTIATKGTIVEARDIVATEKKTTTKNSDKRTQRVQPITRGYAKRTMPHTLRVR
jgi:hypothetical protein